MCYNSIERLSTNMTSCKSFSYDIERLTLQDCRKRQQVPKRQSSLGCLQFLGRATVQWRLAHCLENDRYKQPAARVISIVKKVKLRQWWSPIIPLSYLNTVSHDPTWQQNRRCPTPLTPSSNTRDPWTITRHDPGPQWIGCCPPTHRSLDQSMRMRVSAARSRQRRQSIEINHGQSRQACLYLVHYTMSQDLYIYIRTSWCRYVPLGMDPFL